MNTYRYSCSRCGYVIETKGPWPYRQGKSRKREKLERMDHASGPIHGLSARVYCPTCDKEKDYIIAEYKCPLMTIDDIWLRDIQRKVRRVCCKCKNPVFLVLPKGSIKCPRCKGGVFEPFQFQEDEHHNYPVPPTKTTLRVRQKGESIHVPKPKVVIDSAEHMGYTFDRFTNWFSGTVRRRLPTGDYTVAGLEDEIAVERKTLPDLVNSIIQERANFITRCERLSGFKKKCIVVEETFSSLKTLYEESQAHPNAVLGSLIAAQERWDIPVYFLDSFLLAEEFVANMLSKYHAYRWLETNGYDRCMIEGDI